MKCKILVEKFWPLHILDSNYFCEKVMKEMVEEVRESEVGPKSGAFKTDDLCCNPTILTDTIKEGGREVGLDCPKVSDAEKNNKLTCAKNEWAIFNIQRSKTCAFSQLISLLIQTQLSITVHSSD